MSSIGQQCICGYTPRLDPNPDCERCRLVWTIAKVEEMRLAQRIYFHDRRLENLNAAQQLERMVDKSIERLREVQPELF